MQERTLLILQIVAICLTAVFGALTVFVENVGEKRLSLKGRVALSAAIISGILALITQGVQRHVDNAKAAKDTERTQTLLKSIQRGTYPLFSAPSTITVFWDIPTEDEAFKPYLNEVAKGIEPLLTNKMGIAAWCGKYADPRLHDAACPDSLIRETSEESHKVSIAGIRFRGNSRLFPKRADFVPYSIFSELGVDTCVFAIDNKSTKLDECNLEFTAHPRDNNIEVEFDPRRSIIEVFAYDMPIDMRLFRSDGKIVSLPDLSNARVVVTNNDNAAPEIQRIVDTEKITMFQMTIGGRVFALHTKTVPGPNYVSYTCKLPDSMEYLSDPNVPCS